MVSRIAPPSEILFSEEEIDTRVGELARRISSDYRDADDLLMVGVLKGAFIFLADLSRRLTITRAVDFIAVANYPDSSVPSGVVRLIMDVRESIRDRHVLLVEDIVDTGDTLAYLQRMLGAREPASLRTCAMLRKSKQRSVEPDVDYLGFEIDDEWVVGYGLDYGDQLRTLPYIGVIGPLERVG